jgi:prepilin-type N-terminal cleavage/methylation domain-containing protein/prepilin-type processing-associated H-X9-DG protein
MRCHPVFKQSHRLSDAFTLVELLVTLTIITSIAALSLIGISRMRKTSDRIGSVRNLSQLHIANAGYAVEHGGRYVPVFEFDGDGKGTSEWYKNPAFLVHLKGELRDLGNGNFDTSIPQSLLDPATLRAKKNQYTALYSSFGYNASGMPPPGWGAPNANPSFLLNQVTAPERSAAFLTATDWIVNYSGRFLWKGNGAVEGKTKDQKTAFRHGGKAIVVYYDGHASEVSMADLRAIDVQGGQSHAFWDADKK